MASVTFKADCADKLVESSQPGTFTGNSLSAAVCMTNIDILTDKNYDLMGRAAKLGEADRQLSENIMRIWTQFARTGNPSVPGLVEWPTYDADADTYVALDIPLQVKSGFSLLAASGSREAKYLPAYTWEEAAEHIGETATVTGPVIDWLDFPFPDGLTDPVLGVGKPNGPGALLVRLMVDRESLPEDLYVGKTISIIGEIGPNGFGGARIWVDDLSQIEIIE